MNNNITTLSDFIKLFKDTDKIKAIYLDDENDTILREIQDLSLPTDRLEQHENILTNSEYFVLRNGEYELDTNLAFTQYSDYVLSKFFPVIHQEFADEVDEMIDSLTPAEFIEHLSDMCESCQILIRPPFKDDLDKSFFPEVSSSINCLVLTDYIVEDEETEYSNIVIGVIEDDSKLFDILKKRLSLYTAVYKITNGHPELEKTKLYFTDEHGVVMLCAQHIMAVDNIDDIDETFEDEDE